MASYGPWKIKLNYVPLAFSMFCDFTELSLWFFRLQGISAAKDKGEKGTENAICNW